MDLPLAIPADPSPGPKLRKSVRYHVTVGDASFGVVIDAEGVWVDGDPIEVCAPEPAGPHLYSFLVEGGSHTVLAKRAGSGRWNLQLRGRCYRVDVVDERTRALRDLSPEGSTANGPAPVRAPMPGLVVKVEEGELVDAGGGLLVVEAMKMENLLTAPVRGRVGSIRVVAGQTVEKNEVLMEVLPTDYATESEGD